MTGKQETRLIKSTQASKYKLYSNQLAKQWDSSIRKPDRKFQCHCKIAFFLWPDGF
jgi:hypothetical protein